MKKVWGSFLSMLLIVVLLGIAAGCSTKANTDQPAELSASAGTKQESTQSPVASAASEPVTLKIFTDAKLAQSESYLKLLEDFKAETGIGIEMNIVPGDGVEIYKKIDVELTTGNDTDLIYLSNPLYSAKYATNGWLLPMDDLFSEKGYDAEKVFGKYLEKFDGKTYMLPNSAGVWAVYYNKKIFDDAGVPYPSGAWTWDQYIETAKKLNNPSKGIYGSYMLDYDTYMFILARQKEVSGYKADGTSNYDDPAFKSSLQFFNDLGNVHKIQPNWQEFKTKKLAWDGFMSGNYGMHFIGSWYTGMFEDKVAYPRDWKFGITQIPVPADGGNNNFGSVSSIGISKNSKHPKEAFEYARFYAENSYKYNGNFPARVDLKDAEVNEMFKGTVEKLAGEITVADLQKALIDNNLGYTDEKLIGPASTDYSNIILQEAEMYLVGQTSLDDAVKSIKTRVDKAIQDEANAK